MRVAVTNIRSMMVRIRMYELYHELADSVRLMCNNCNRCELDTSGKPMFKSQACEAYTRKMAVLNRAGGDA